MKVFECYLPIKNTVVFLFVFQIFLYFIHTFNYFVHRNYFSSTNEKRVHLLIKLHGFIKNIYSKLIKGQIFFSLKKGVSH